MSIIKILRSIKKRLMNTSQSMEKFLRRERASPVTIMRRVRREVDPAVIARVRERTKGRQTVRVKEEVKVRIVARAKVIMAMARESRLTKAKTTVETVKATTTIIIKTRIAPLKDRTAEAQVRTGKRSKGRPRTNPETMKETLFPREEEVRARMTVKIMKRANLRTTEEENLLRVKEIRVEQVVLRTRMAEERAREAKVAVLKARVVKRITLSRIRTKTITRAVTEEEVPPKIKTTVEEVTPKAEMPLRTIPMAEAALLPRTPREPRLRTSPETSQATLLLTKVVTKATIKEAPPRVMTVSAAHPKAKVTKCTPKRKVTRKRSKFLAKRRTKVA